MSNQFEKYLLHPIEKPITDADAKVELICSKDHPVMEFFYESCFYRHDYVIADSIYALPYTELFLFCSTNGKDDELDAEVTVEINGKKLTVDKPCCIQIPAFVPHGNMEISKVKTPVFSFVTGYGAEHVAIPEENWETENVQPLEEMVLYCDYAPEIDPVKVGDQHYVLKYLSGKTLKGEFPNGIFRRFHPTDGWLYVPQAHVHASPEIIAYYGTDGWNPYELNGSYTVYAGGEEYTFDKPTLCYYASYLPHCPIDVHKLEKENFWHTLGRSVGAFNAQKTFEMPNINVKDGPIELKKPW